MSLIQALLFWLLFSLVVGSSVSVSLQLNTTTPEWGQVLNASGFVKDSLGNGWQGNVTVKVDGKYACSTNSSSTGFYNCTFTAPDDLGIHVARAYALDNGVVGESSPVNFWTVYTYGSEKEYGSVAAISFPVLIQQISGKISVVTATLKIWR